MKKHTSPTPIHVPPNKSLADHLEEHPWIEWFSTNGKALLYALLGVVLLSILLFRFFGSSEKSQKDFYEAEKSILTLQQNPEDTQQALSQLETILNAHPELHAKYDGLIAQALLIKGDAEEATPFAERAIKRTESENAPFYTDFAKTTLLIGNKQFEEALQQAKSLQEKMGAEENFQNENSLFIAYNLLRIGMLQQQVGAKEDARQTWKQWNELAQRSSATGMNSNGFLLLNRAFSEGKLTLLNYTVPN